MFFSPATVCQAIVGFTAMVVSSVDDSLKPFWSPVLALRYLQSMQYLLYDLFRQGAISNLNRCLLRVSRFSSSFSTSSFPSAFSASTSILSCQSYLLASTMSVPKSASSRGPKLRDLPPSLVSLYVAEYAAYLEMSRSTDLSVHNWSFTVGDRHKDCRIETLVCGSSVGCTAVTFTFL